MKKILLATLLALTPASAWAQCTGVFPNNTLCGNISGSPAPPGQVPISGTVIVGPGSSTNNGLPLWNGTSGTILKDGAGGTIAGNYTWSGTQSWLNTVSHGSNGGTGGSAQFFGATSGSSTVKVNAVAGASTFQLPVGNGSANQGLQTDGSGNTSWANTVNSVVIAGTANNIAVSGTCTITTTGTCTVDLASARKTNPTTQVFTSGSGTYTTPANVLWIEVELCGGGGGGAGSGTAPGAGGSGGATTWGTGPLLSSGTATGGSGTTGGSGGSPSGGYLNQAGIAGGSGSGSTTANPGGPGGNSWYGGGGAGGVAGAGPGQAAATNSCSGGGGGGVNTTASGGGGGGAGGMVRAIFGAPNATYSYAVGAAGTAGTAGGSGAAGGAGAAGRIAVVEHYN